MRTPVRGRAADHGAQRLRGAPTLPMTLPDRRGAPAPRAPSASQRAVAHLDVVGVLHDALDEVLERFVKHGQLASVFGAGGAAA